MKNITFFLITVALAGFTVSAAASVDPASANVKNSPQIRSVADPFASESRDGDKPYAIVEWLPAGDKPQGVLSGNAFSEVETVPAAK